MAEVTQLGSGEIRIRTQCLSGNVIRKKRAMMCIILVVGLSLKGCFVNERGHIPLIRVLLLGLRSALPTWELPCAQPGHPEARPGEPQPFRPMVLKPEHKAEPPAGPVNTGMCPTSQVSDAGNLRQA